MRFVKITQAQAAKLYRSFLIRAVFQALANATAAREFYEIVFAYAVFNILAHLRRRLGTSNNGKFPNLPVCLDNRFANRALTVNTAVRKLLRRRAGFILHKATRNRLCFTAARRANIRRARRYAERHIHRHLRKKAHVHTRCFHHFRKLVHRQNDVRRLQFRFCFFTANHRDNTDRLALFLFPVILFKHTRGNIRRLIRIPLAGSNGRAALFFFRRNRLYPSQGNYVLRNRRVHHRIRAHSAKDEGKLRHNIFPFRHAELFTQHYANGRRNLHHHENLFLIRIKELVHKLNIRHSIRNSYVHHSILLFRPALFAQDTLNFSYRARQRACYYKFYSIIA